MSNVFKLSLDPQTVKQWKRFRSIKRGYYSAVILVSLLLLSCFAELLVNSRAIIVSYEGKWYFPTYAWFISGDTFGLDYDWETNYRELRQHFKEQKEGNWVLMPLVPYNPFETEGTTVGATPPSWETKHFLGTDGVGRDILARLVYGFRIAMGFSLVLLVFSYVAGIAIGCAMGYWGGAFDLVFQRLIEIWNTIPFLYVIMIVASIVETNFWILVFVMVLFGWTAMTWNMRTSTYKEKAREYVNAARALGSGNARVIGVHILPNTISVIVTFIPFSIAGGITALTALDYLGFGLRPPTPSWGAQLREGTQSFDHPWIVWSVATAIILILLMVTFIGEAIREAFDPKKFTYYE
ncbi:MAG: ABC transporter permease subunit [Gammaproteobacteria bacterium]|nr:ABC transporter permease subunit [Gammaproteobacteria bacterium]